MSKSGAILFALCISISFVGCTHVQLRKHTNQQLRTTSEITQQQIMDNLAKIAANEDAWPEFSNFSSGGTQVTDLGEANVNFAWNARTITQELLGLKANRQLVEKWELKATTDPARLRAMWAVYHYTVYGNIPERGGYDANLQLTQVFHTPDWQALVPPPGWIKTYSEHEYCEKVQCGCVVGHACDCHACVLPGHQQDLQQLTYLIMYISGATFVSAGGGEAAFPDGLSLPTVEMQGTKGMQGTNERQSPRPGPAKDFNTFSPGAILTPQ